jgi:hypothetical protein
MVITLSLASPLALIKENCYFYGEIFILFFLSILIDLRVSSRNHKADVSVFLHNKNKPFLLLLYRTKMYYEGSPHIQSYVRRQYPQHKGCCKI